MLTISVQFKILFNEYSAGRKVPRGCKCPARALTGSPTLSQYGRKGPKRLRQTAGAIQPEAGTQEYIHTQHVHKRSNNSINIKTMHIPLRLLSFCIHGPTPMATEGGLDRSYPRKVRSRPCAGASNTESQQGGEAPRGCK